MAAEVDDSGGAWREGLHGTHEIIHPLFFEYRTKNKLRGLKLSSVGWVDTQ